MSEPQPSVCNNDIKSIVSLLHRWCGREVTTRWSAAVHSVLRLAHVELRPQLLQVWQEWRRKAVDGRAGTLQVENQGDVSRIWRCRLSLWPWAAVTLSGCRWRTSTSLRYVTCSRPRSDTALLAHTARRRWCLSLRKLTETATALSLSKKPATFCKSRRLISPPPRSVCSTSCCQQPPNTNLFSFFNARDQWTLLRQFLRATTTYA